VLLLRQHPTCTSIRDSRLLCRFTNVDTKNDAVLSFIVQIQSLSAQYLLSIYFFFLVSWGRGMRVWPLGTSATNWPVIPAPDDG
jgi:hypothetical protein